MVISNGVMEIILHKKEKSMILMQVQAKHLADAAAALVLEPQRLEVREELGDEHDEQSVRC